MGIVCRNGRGADGEGVREGAGGGAGCTGASREGGGVQGRRVGEGFGIEKEDFFCYQRCDNRFKTRRHFKVGGLRECLRGGVFRSGGAAKRGERDREIGRTTEKQGRKKREMCVSA